MADSDVRSSRDTRLLVLVNLSSEPARVELDADAGVLEGRLLLGEDPGPGGVLPAWGQAVVLG